MNFAYNLNLYPTPPSIIHRMIEGVDLENKIILEPSAGVGNIVTELKQLAVKEVIACEIDPNLRAILKEQCRVIAEDFLKVTSDMISHVDCIIMNPPFNADEDHLIHAYNIAPAGCTIISLCNYNTIKNASSEKRRQLKTLISNYGKAENFGDCFSTAERKTLVDIGFVKLQKPADNYEQEFEGFFLEEEEEPNAAAPGIMTYNFIRDLVNRYIAAVKLFDQQLLLGIQMNNLTGQFYKSSIAFECKEKDKLVTRNSYKKDLQKNAWLYIFSKMNMQKLLTNKLKEDLNKFVEHQSDIPFTMRNIYHMLDTVIQTTDERMNKALEEVFDRVTRHYHENRYNVEGWKTNSRYLLNQKFILPNVTRTGWSGQLAPNYTSNTDVIDDFMKALCYITGENWDDIGTFFNHFHNRTTDEKDEYGRAIKFRYEFNTWYDFGFFWYKGFKKQTGHFRFKDQKVWEMVNQRIAKIKGYPLFEKASDYYAEKEQQPKKRTAKKRQPSKAAPKVKSLADIQLNIDATGAMSFAV